MNKIIEYFKNEESYKNTLIVLLLAGSLAQSGKLILAHIFISWTSYGLFGLDSISNQMIFCLHLTNILYILITLTLGFLFDRFILKEKFGSIPRSIFWVGLTIFVISKLSGHYNIINSMIYNEETFKFLKSSICY